MVTPHGKAAGDPVKLFADEPGQRSDRLNSTIRLTPRQVPPVTGATYGEAADVVGNPSAASAER